MKTFVPKALLMAVTLLFSAAVFSQAVISTETFPNEFNSNGTPGADGTFSGNQGTWTVSTNNYVSIGVDANQYVSSPRALFLESNSNNASTGNSITSPNVNLAFGGCVPASATIAFSILPRDVENGNANFTVGLELFNGTSWASVWSKTADQLYDSYVGVVGGSNTNWQKVSLPLGNTYWNNLFKYRFVVTKGATSGGASSNEVWIDNVEIATVTTGPAFPDFSDATPTRIVDGGSVGGGVEVGDVYKFDNVVSIPTSIYAEIKIEAISNAVVVNLDNNAEGIAQRFQPRIAPSSATLTGDKEGYVQFAITFKKVSNNAVVTLEGLRFRHFDLDGNQDNSGGDRYTFRETGWVVGQTGILVNNPSDLSSTSGGTDGYGAWSKVLGELAEHDGVSSDADVYFTTTYSPTSTIRFRLGYIFDETAGSVTFTPGATGREYGTEFGCFDIRENAILPLTLLSFSGAYQNNQGLLSWATENEENTDRFEIERSIDGKTFSKVGFSAAQGTNSGKTNYQFADDLSGVSANAVYYRLKCIDRDGKFTYSKIVGLYKDAKSGVQISVVPNPVVNTNATLRINTTTKGTADLRIIDFGGRVLRTQKLNLYEGSNSVSLTGMEKLTPGVYSAQVYKDGEMMTTRFVVGK